MPRYEILIEFMGMAQYNVSICNEASQALGPVFENKLLEEKQKIAI